MEGDRLDGVALGLSAASLNAASLANGIGINFYADLHHVASGEPLGGHLVSMAELNTADAHRVCILEPKANSFELWNRLSFL